MLKRLMMLLLIILLAGCLGEYPGVEKSVPEGNPEAGRTAIATYGCGSCHYIAGIREAVAYTGPPLIEFERRHYIAGNLPNTAENLIYWIQFPQLVEPGTAMPDLNVTETDARNIAAYLYNQ
jgi:cytochrome c